MKKLLLFFALIFIFSFTKISLAEEKSFSIFLDKSTIARGYTVSAFDDYIKLSLVPGILSEDTEVSIEEIPNYHMSLPWNLKQESSIIQFEFKNKAAYGDHNPFYIQLNYDESSNNYKQLFFYDSIHNSWRPLPTQDFPKDKFIRSLIHLPYARVAVFSYPEIYSVGEASWYKHKGGNFAASPDFPKDSKLRVHNLNNDKFVDIVVNDFGPDKSIFPNRIIDLDYEAFKKIADKGDGLINIIIEPLFIPADNFSRRLNIGIGSASTPEINSRSAILIRESDKKIFFQKNINEVLPIASLTKIFSVFNFLAYNNNSERLDEIISYDLQDEKYNNQYFPNWQVARVNLNSGDQLSIKDLVYSSLVRSANNTVESLVRVSGLKREEFLKQVNNWAKENGAPDFYINDPTGLDEKNVASVRDLAILSSLVFDNNIIRDASIAQSYRFYTRNDNSLKLRYNSSDLVLNNNYNNFKIIGSKTGYLDSASYCLITRAEIKGEKFLAIVLSSPSRAASFRETIDLFDFAHYSINK